jgi:PAS domain S-box-containing protein
LRRNELGATPSDLSIARGIPVHEPRSDCLWLVRGHELMTFIIATLLGALAILVAAIAGLLVQRTRRSRTERALRERNERLRLIVEQTPAMVWTMRPDSTLDFLNRTCMTFSGLPIEKLLDDGWLDAVHPDDRDRCVGIYVPAVEARRPFLAEYRLRHADGSYRWLLATGVPKYEADDSFSGYIGCDVDITERKNAEDQIRASQAALEASHQEIQYLAGRLIEAQEVERARIARDLHDDVSQQLAGVSIAFSGLKQRLGEYHVSEELRQELVELQQQTLRLARNVRQLSHDLHPAVLQHLGLVKGLTSYCGELGRAHGVTMTSTAEGDFGAITPDAALCIYRIAQEALRNVIAHAGASHADVRLLQIGDQAQITIADDGRGFDATNRVERDTGLGLVSMSERARMIGGTVSIVSALNQGTRVQATIPMNVCVKLDVGSGMEGQVA